MSYYYNYENNEIDKQYLKIIKGYLNDYSEISKDNIIDADNNDLSFKRFKIINNQLYACFDISERNIWESRRESIICLLLETLKKYIIPDIEFVITYDWDSINDKNVHKMYDTKNNKLPIIVSTSILENMNFIMCPDFTFQFCPEYNYKNNFIMCDEVIKKAESYNFNDKINKLLWRGSGNNNYRGNYCNLTNKFHNYIDIKSVLSHTKVRGQESNTFEQPESITRYKKIFYKYLLHLNGHEGNNNNGAYSSSFKWCLMTNSLVFYSSPNKYKEFWTHKDIFRENEHYIHSRDSIELVKKLQYYMNNELEATNIARNGFEFYKKYLHNYDLRKYMFMLFSEYKKKLNYQVIIDKNDTIIHDVRYDTAIFFRNNS